MAGFESGFRKRQESQYTVAEEDIRWMLGDISDEEFEGVQEAFTELRAQIDRMQWFSAGPNSVTTGKRAEQWSEFVFAPSDSAHEEEIKQILAKLKIFPWEEVSENVRVLIVENRRDVALLREGLIFDYLADAQQRTGREKSLIEQRVKYAQERRVSDSMNRIAVEDAQVTEQKKAEDEAYAAAKAIEEADKEWNLRIDVEGAEYREMKKAERDARIAAVFASIPHVPKEEFERPIRLPRDHQYRFGYPHTMRGNKSHKPRAYEPIAPRDEDESTELDTLFRQMDQDFMDGKINEDELQEGLVREVPTSSNSVPSMKLFPKKYDWIPAEGKTKAFLREHKTQQTITDEDIENVVLFAQQAQGRDRDVAIREISLMHRALILWLIRSMKDKHAAVNPDALLQTGLMGLTYAVDHFEKRDDSGFRSYLLPCMEGHMRRISANAQFNLVHVPINISADRKKVFLAQQALRARRPEAAVEPLDVAKFLHEEETLKDDSIGTYDRYLRKVFLAYQETGLNSFEDESFGVHDVDMKGESLYAPPLQENAAEYTELKSRLAHVLLSMTPREERAVRAYFEIEGEPGKTGAEVYEALREDLRKQNPEMTLEEVQVKVRDLTSHGNLHDPEVLAELSDADREIALSYVNILNKESGRETFESVANEYGVTRERIRQIIAKALRKLKHPVRGRKLGPYIDYRYRND